MKKTLAFLAALLCAQAAHAVIAPVKGSTATFKRVEISTAADSNANGKAKYFFDVEQNKMFVSFTDGVSTTTLFSIDTASFTYRVPTASMTATNLFATNLTALNSSLGTIASITASTITATSSFTATNANIGTLAVQGAATAASFTAPSMTAGNFVANSATATTVVASSATLTELISTTATIKNINGSGAWGFRNRIINGDMRIDQANVGSTVTVNDSAVFNGADRFAGAGQSADGVFAVQRTSVTPPFGFNYYTRATVTTADASVGSTQNYVFFTRNEGYNTSDFEMGKSSTQTFTLSFYVRSSVTGTFGGAFRNAAGNRSYPFTYTIDSANTWERESVTVTNDHTGTWVIDSSNFGVSVTWSLGTGSSRKATAGVWDATTAVDATGTSTAIIETVGATWDITGVQLEVGSQVTAFEFRPFALEFEMAEVYYGKTFPAGIVPASGAGTGGAFCYRVSTAGVVSAMGMYADYPKRMRATPTVTFFNTGTSGSNWWNESDGVSSGASSINSERDRGGFLRNNQAAGDSIGDLLCIHATFDSRL